MAAMVVNVAMPMDENTSPQAENVMRSNSEAKLRPEPVKPVGEKVSSRSIYRILGGQKRPAAVDSAVEPLDSMADVPPTKRQRISTWLSDSSSRVLAHALPLGTWVASEVKGRATKAAITTGTGVKVYGAKAVVLAGTAAKGFPRKAAIAAQGCVTKAGTAAGKGVNVSRKAAIAAKGYATKAGTAAGKGVKVCVSKAAIAAAPLAKAAGNGVKGCATKATVAAREATVTWSQRAIGVASKRVGRTAASAAVQVKDAAPALVVDSDVPPQQKVAEVQHDSKAAPIAEAAVQPLPEVVVEPLPELAAELLELPSPLRLRLRETLEDNAALERDASLEAQELQGETPSKDAESHADVLEIPLAHAEELAEEDFAEELAQEEFTPGLAEEEFAEEFAEYLSEECAEDELAEELAEEEFEELMEEKFAEELAKEELEEEFAEELAEEEIAEEFSEYLDEESAEDVMEAEDEELAEFDEADMLANLDPELLREMQEAEDEEAELQEADMLANLEPELQEAVGEDMQEAEDRLSMFRDMQEAEDEEAKYAEDEMQP